MREWISKALPRVAHTLRGRMVANEPGGRVAADEMPPLSATSRWNSGARRATTIGEVSSAYTLTAPADSPIRVTRPGSPPKRATLACTNSSDLTMSSSAKLPESGAAAPVLSGARSRKPKTPRR
jgi:hypothetical protein